MNTSHTPGPLTPAQERALQRAASRPNGCICPVVGRMGPAAETALIAALRRKGWATDDAAPRITDAGRAAIAKATGADHG